MFILQPTVAVVMRKGCTQPEVCLKSRRNIFNCCLNSAVFLQVWEIFLTVFNYFGQDFFFISERQVNEEKGNSANLFEISSYLCLSSIREITSSIYATTAKELSL